MFQKKFKNRRKEIITSIHRVQAHDPIMCGYFVMGLLILCYKIKVCYIIQIYFLLTNTLKE